MVSVDDHPTYQHDILEVNAIWTSYSILESKQYPKDIEEYRCTHRTR